MTSSQQIRVNIIGAGLSGGCLANALLEDRERRFSVQIFERDDLAFSSERGGYQIRLGRDGIWGLKECLRSDTYLELREVWGNEISRAPAVIDPFTGRIAARLNSLKVYPKSRAVPRSALKDNLLRLPLERGAVRLGKRLVSVHTALNKQTDMSEVICTFDDGSRDVCDILVAADGSRSVVNSCMGVNNTIRLQKQGIQGRGPINAETYARLPDVLKENGSLLHFGGEITGFTAVYETSSLESKTDSFLFWGCAVPADVTERIIALPTDTDKHRALLAYLATTPIDPKLLPAIIENGLQNLKISSSTTSKLPGDWRAGNMARGRIIFIGDSIHAMTAGRGQGANQALRDAGALQGLLKRRFSASQLPSDKEVFDTAVEFDKEMYPRAFGWVRSSERASEINLQSWANYIFFRAVIAALTVLGLGVSALEALRLRSPESVSF